METIKKASATNSFMNIIYTLYIIADVKSISSILYSPGNIQAKSYWVQWTHLPLSYIKLAKTSVSRGLS